MSWTPPIWAVGSYWWLRAETVKERALQAAEHLGTKGSLPFDVTLRCRVKELSDTFLLGSRNPPAPSSIWAVSILPTVSWSCWANPTSPQLARPTVRKLTTFLIPPSLHWALPPVPPACLWGPNTDAPSPQWSPLTKPRTSPGHQNKFPRQHLPTSYLLPFTYHPVFPAPSPALSTFPFQPVSWPDFLTPGPYRQGQPMYSLPPGGFRHPYPALAMNASMSRWVLGLWAGKRQHRGCLSTGSPAQLSLGSKQRSKCSPFLPASLISCGVETTGSAHSCPISLSKRRILKPLHSVLLHVPLWAGQGLVALKHFEYVRLEPEAGRLIVPKTMSGEELWKRMSVSGANLPDNGTTNDKKKYNPEHKPFFPFPCVPGLWPPASSVFHPTCFQHRI